MRFFIDKHIESYRNAVFGENTHIFILIFIENAY